MTDPLKFIQDLNDQRPTEIVDFGGRKTTVVGLSAGGDIKRLLQRFPVVAAMVTGGNFDMAEIVKAVPDAAAPIIAAGFRKMGDDKFEAACAELSLDQTLALVTKIGKATMPDGPGPFKERAKQAARELGFKLASETPSEASAKPSPT
jgi:hypothetical protein